MQNMPSQQREDNFAAMFAAMEDEYFQARAVDMKDISERVIDVLMGIGEAKSWTSVDHRGGRSGAKRDRSV